MTNGTEVEWTPGTSLVVVRGEVDLGARRHLSGVLCSAVDAAEPDADLVVDLGGVAFMDSTGLQCLVSAHRRAAARGVRLVLGPVSEPTSLVIRTTGLDALFHFDPPLAD
ncbi:MAG: STAS domain-containing protein [Actinobacteria bacterium]|nr:STAS domain-containing protein [Actinomycetota bacterium]